MELNSKISAPNKKLMAKANSILISSDYSDVNEIFKKVFNKEELDIINKNHSKEENNDDIKEDEDNEKVPFFTTQIY